MNPLKLFFQSALIGGVGGLTALFLIMIHPDVTFTLTMDKDLKKQIDEINSIEKSLNSLQLYLINQKNELRKENAALAEIKKERKKLEPVLNTDINTVNSIFELQQKHYRKKIWFDKVIGFLFGFISSLSASVFVTWWNRKKSKTNSDI